MGCSPHTRGSNGEATVSGPRRQATPASDVSGTTGCSACCRPQWRIRMTARGLVCRRWVSGRLFVFSNKRTAGGARRGKAARLSPRGRAGRGAEANGGAEQRIAEYKRNTSGIRAEHKPNTSDQHASPKLYARHARSNLAVMRRASSHSPSARVRGHGCLILPPSLGSRARHSVRHGQ
jgi:hypothetical protein